MKQFDRTDAERLVQTYSDLILRLAYTYLKSTHDAEDICQNIFLKLLTGGHTFDSPAHEKAWIIRATANACKDILKSPWRKRTCGLEACAQIPAPEAADGRIIWTQRPEHWSVRHSAGRLKMPVIMPVYMRAGTGTITGCTRTGLTVSIASGWRSTAASRSIRAIISCGSILQRERSTEYPAMLI